MKGNQVGDRANDGCQAINSIASLSSVRYWDNGTGWLAGREGHKQQARLVLRDGTVCVLHLASCPIMQKNKNKNNKNLIIRGRARMA